MGVAQRPAACASGLTRGVQTVGEPAQPTPDCRTGKSSLGPLWSHSEARAAEWTGYAEIDDDATDQMLYCTAVAGTELNELLSSLSTREGLALITLEDNVPAFVPEAVRKTVLTVSEAKGLDFHSLRAGCRTPHRTHHSRGWP